MQSSFRQSPKMEFHVSRTSRDRYQFDESIFEFDGNVVFANFRAARLFAQKMNQQRDLVSFPEQAVQAGHINAMGLIDEISHLVFRAYREQTNPAMLRDALAYLDQRLGRGFVDVALHRFGEQFPPVAVYRSEQTLEEYMRGSTGDATHREATLEEMLMLWLANMNPAFKPFGELFDDGDLERGARYTRIIASLQEFLAAQPVPFGGAAGAQNIIDLLRAPALASPHSLEGQLSFIRDRWGSVIGQQLLYRLLTSMDVIKEEGRSFLSFGPGGGDATAASVHLTEFRVLEAEPERFTPDREWMPRCVLIAKNAFVWLDQLSKQYRQPIPTLADIPDDELDRLASYGITGLWLIGLWERSAASKRIKQMMGNPEAVASAYSLYDYVIAHDLGGEEACDKLRERAWQRGIRLASDMVPNHVGIDGRWVIEHPDWFIALDEPPFPGYSFNGVDLSSDDRVGIFIEDHYYDRTDAAVVFKRLDRWTGSAQYIYHGNDGTSMPWNDTAQLNYLNPAVREGVIQTILHVARQFPIIRFDAAMTLAKRHYQRLWFPEPGTGGDIPSRAEHGLTKAQFDAAMPEEFWREVVDRCAVEAPDTLLLAEAFWLMEGYFVRTLGMHRVYNSAFMVLLRDEDNAKYRQLMKNTLEFDPEILKRYVNFMNNPDERTAVDQFGKDDKYFGVCTLLATMPGLPMFGHGQIEGYTEKYGMEYRRAYYDELPDGWLIGRHEREVFPLLHRRYLFSGVEHFLLYDFFTVDGGVNENVFAISNGYRHERALVIYHNKYDTVRGWVRTSAAFAVKTGQGDEKTVVQRTLAEGLGLRAGEQDYTIFRDHAAGLEYIRHSRELRDQGLYVELGAYKCHAFLDFREVTDVDGSYGRIAASLAGQGVPSVDEAVRELMLQPLHTPLRELISAETYRAILEWVVAGEEVSGRREPGVVSQEVEDARLAAKETRSVGAQRAAPGEPLPASEKKAPAEAAASDRGVTPDKEQPVAGKSEAQPALQAASIPGEVEQKLIAFLAAAEPFGGDGGAPEAIAAEIRGRLEVLRELANAGPPRRRDARPETMAQAFLASEFSHELRLWGTALSWLFVHRLGALTGDDVAEQSRSWIDEWLLGRVIARALHDLGIDEAQIGRTNALVKVLTAHQDWFAENGKTPAHTTLAALLEDGEARRFLQVNRHQGVLWFNKEAFAELLWWLQVVAAVTAYEASADPAQRRAALGSSYAVIDRLRRAEAASGYQVERLIEAAKQP